MKKPKRIFVKAASLMEAQAKMPLEGWWQKASKKGWWFCPVFVNRLND